MTSTPVSDNNSEKRAAGVSFGRGTNQSNKNQPDAHHHYATRARERLQHFLHPSGKRVHIALSPEEAHNIRRKLERIHSTADFDIFISGTQEHLNALREAQTHHEDRRTQLRDQHAEVYDQFADVHAELDALANELHRVTTHGVSLEAHFDRFGYNAFVKTYDDDSPSESGISTPRTSSSEKQESQAERGFATTLKVFKTPVLRQYFHKGVIWRASTAEEVQCFELFVDLLYVGIIAINGDAAASNPTGLSLLRFVITFNLSFKIWNDMALLISWFETDDLFQRVSIIFLLTCLFGYTTNLTQAFDTTYATLIGFYLAARLYMSAYLALVSFLMPNVKGVLWYYNLNCLVGAALWIGSIHTPYPAQLALIFVAMFVDIVGSTSFPFFMLGLSKLGPRIKDWVDRAFEFTPAINIEHRTERMNAFVTLVFGYTVVAILYQSTVNGIDDFFGKGILGLIQAFIFNWLYFEIDSSDLHLHAIRRARMTAVMWTTAHIPFIMSFVLAGGALARLVVAADTPNARIAHLTDEYQARSTTTIAPGIRWFYCAGLGVALICMGAISLSHVHKDPEGMRLPKRFRLVGRFAVAAVLVCLPLATRLDSLQLVGIVTALIVALLVVELWATSCCSEKLFGRSRACRYTGQCGKKRLQALLKEGGAVNVDAIEADQDKFGGMALGP